MEKKEIKIAKRSVKIDIEGIGKGVYDMHCMDNQVLNRLKFGLLDAKIMESMEQNFKNELNKSYSEEVRELFSARINRFVTDCMKDISILVYKYASNKMVV